MKLIITSAYRLSNEEVANIRARLGVNSQAEVEQKIDPSIVGGFIIEYGSFYLNNSLSGKLQQIGDNLHL